MATSKQQSKTQYYQEHEAENDDSDYSESEGSDPESDSDIDPSYNLFAETQSKLSNLCIKKGQKSCFVQLVFSVAENGIKVDEKSFVEVQKIIEDGQIEKLKVEQCKMYLRKNGLRLSGNKDTLILRIKEHQEILNGGGEQKYPTSSFVLNCKGDACTGDVVMFEQNVYEMYSIASRSASGPPCGTRIIGGRIVKESYGAAKQQHTFTTEVLWSKGEKPFPPLHQLLIKGRNLYRLKILRQRWDDEGERSRVLMEKHSRGLLARSDREKRIQDKEQRKMLGENRALKKKQNWNQFQVNCTSKVNLELQAQQLGPSVYLETAACQPQQSGVFVASQKMEPSINDYRFQSPLHKQPSKNLELSNRNYCGQPLTSTNHYRTISPHRQRLRGMNHSCPTSPPHRQSHQQKQVCWYYAQGRCYYGDSCKFLHE